MNKKEYMKPALRVVSIKVRHQLLAGSQVNHVSGTFGYGGGSSHNTGNIVRSREDSRDDWDDNWDE